LPPLDDEAAVHQAALAEIERQGQQRVTQLQAWIQWWTTIKNLATETGDKLAKNFEQRIENAQKAGATLGGLWNSAPPAGA
jgi:hypothetical protein